MNEVTIEAKNISKIYKLYDKPTYRMKESLSITKKSYHKNYFALNDVSFSISKGETVGIVGKNGSGKSTLLKILTGVLTPSSGEMNVNGKVSALLELGAGFNNEYTGIENIYLNGTIMGYSHKEMEEKIDDIISFADIGDYVYQPVKMYSSGMFVRLAFAVAINVNPDILIIDEALAVGDIRFQLKCMDKFLEFKKKGITIIFVSHDVNAIKRFCDRTLWINEGHLEDDGDTDTVTDKYLDYLKRLDANIENVAANEKIEDNVNSKDCGNNIANIENLTLLDEFDNSITEVKHGQRLRVKLEYSVNDINVQNPVVGIALLRVDNLYICGVNTLLDSVDIQWRKGHNEIILEYDDFNLVGGTYYFDVALYDQTATVPFDYKTKFKEFFVKMDYIAEGIAVLSHRWKGNK